MFCRLGHFFLHSEAFVHIFLVHLEDFVDLDILVHLEDFVDLDILLHSEDILDIHLATFSVFFLT